VAKNGSRHDSTPNGSGCGHVEASDERKVVADGCWIADGHLDHEQDECRACRRSETRHRSPPINGRAQRPDQA